MIISRFGQKRQQNNMKLSETESYSVVFLMTPSHSQGQTRPTPPAAHHQPALTIDTQH